MEIIPGIHRLVAPLGDRIVACYLLRGERRTLLLDTAIEPLVASHLVPALEAAGCSPDALDWVVISHGDFDHTGGGAAVHALAPRALLCCHELDYPLVVDVEALIRGRYRCYAAADGIDETPESLAWMRANIRHAPIDLRLRGGEAFELGGAAHYSVLHVPGHSQGHLALYDPGRRILLAQDCVLGAAVPTASGQPAFPPTYRYVDDYLATIDFLAKMPIEVLLTAHYPPLLSSAAVREFLTESRRFVETLDRALVQALSSARGAATMLELIAELSPRMGRWPKAAAASLAWPLTGHLERLAERKAVCVEHRGSLAAYLAPSEARS